MLIRIYEGIVIFVDKHVGTLAIELDNPTTPNDAKPEITYFGVEGNFDRTRILLAPAEETDVSKIWLVEPQIGADKNHIVRHRYLIRHEGGDIYARHPVYRNLTVIEHYDEDNGGRSWEMALEGLDARIVMPKDYNVVQEVQTA